MVNSAEMDDEQELVDSIKLHNAVIDDLLKSLSIRSETPQERVLSLCRIVQGLMVISLGSVPIIYCLSEVIHPSFYTVAVIHCLLAVLSVIELFWRNPKLWQYEWRSPGSVTIWILLGPMLMFFITPVALGVIALC